MLRYFTYQILIFRYYEIFRANWLNILEHISTNKVKMSNISFIVMIFFNLIFPPFKQKKKEPKTEAISTFIIAV